MSITINLAPELEQEARRIADLDKRVEDFIRSLVELDNPALRAQRRGDTSRDL